MLKMILAALVRTVMESDKQVTDNGYAAMGTIAKITPSFSLGKKQSPFYLLINILCTITKLSKVLNPSYQYRSIYLLHRMLDLSTSIAQSIDHYIFARVIMAICIASNANCLIPKSLGNIFYNTQHYFFNTQRASLIRPRTGIELIFNVIMTSQYQAIQ